VFDRTHRSGGARRRPTRIRDTALVDAFPTRADTPPPAAGRPPCRGELLTNVGSKTRGRTAGDLRVIDLTAASPTLAIVSARTLARLSRRSGRRRPPSPRPLRSAHVGSGDDVDLDWPSDLEMQLAVVSVHPRRSQAGSTAGPAGSGNDAQYTVDLHVRPQFALALAAPRTRAITAPDALDNGSATKPTCVAAAVVLGPIRPARRVELPPLRATEGRRFTATLNDHETRHAVTGQRREDLAGRSVAVHAETHGWQVWAPTGRWLRVKDRKTGAEAWQANTQCSAHFTEGGRGV
jgi:hypothetical protein